MDALVSILIPAFNVEAFVGDAIRSALDQTWPRTEIVVVDDGSTDRTAAVCREFSSPVLTFVTQTHQGAAAARNNALSRCRGDYIQWLDADDLLAPDKVAKQLASIDTAEDRRALLSCAWAHFRYRPHRATFIPSPLWADLSPAEWLFRKLGLGVYMQNATWLVSREVTDAAGPWDTRLSVDDDGEYFCRVLLASDRIRFVPDARTFYRRRIGSLSVIGNSKKKIEDQFLSVQMHIYYLLSIEDSERTRAACIRYLQRYLVYAYPDAPEIVDEARRLAVSLGGYLVTPQLSWKYAWLQRLFGWRSAQRARVAYNWYKSAFLTILDRSLARLEKRKWTLGPT